MNNTKCVGTLWSGYKPEIHIEQTKEGNFLNSESEIKDWVECLNNPWSGTSISYEVTPNYLDGGWIATI